MIQSQATSRPQPPLFLFPYLFKKTFLFLCELMKAMRRGWLGACRHWDMGSYSKKKSTEFLQSNPNGLCCFGDSCSHVPELPFLTPSITGNYNPVCKVCGRAGHRQTWLMSSRR